MKTHWSKNFITVLATLAMVFSTFGQFAGPALANPAGTHQLDNLADATAGEVECGDPETIGSSGQPESEEWHFILNGLGSADSPESITVVFDNAGEITIPATKRSGGAEHYTITTDDVPLPDTILDAWVSESELPAGWNGQFVLSHMPCGDTATITISPDGNNNVGDEHEFTITVTGTAALSNLVITTSVTPGPDEESDTCDAPVLSAGDTVATCTLTINNDEVGSFMASASATGDVGSTAFDISTDGEGDNSEPAVKDYNCLTHTVTLTVTEAGKSQFSHDQFVNETWLVNIFYKIDGGDPVEVEAPLDDDEAGVGFLSFSAVIVISTPDSPYTASLEWGFEIVTDEDEVIYSSLVDGGYVALEGGLTNEGDCTSPDSLVSPVSVITIIKVDDADADGDLTLDELLLGGLEGWTFTATSTLGEVVLTTVTDEFGASTGWYDDEDNLVTDLDDLIGPWTVCEVGQTGWTLTFSDPEADGDGCVVVEAGTTAEYTFGNAYLEAGIAITPETATNFVGDAHVFTVTVTARTTGASPTFGTITTVVDPTPDLQNETSCNDPAFDSEAELDESAEETGFTLWTATCTITINSSVTGTYTADASTTVTLGVLEVSVDTAGDSGLNGSGTAEKTYVCNYCSPGYWKTHTNRWDGTDDPVGKKDGTDFVDDYNTNSDFFTTFGNPTAGEAGLSGDYGKGGGAYKDTTLGVTTLQDVLNMLGGGKTALARHAVAALLNASATGMELPSDIDTAAEVIAIYRAAVVDGTLTIAEATAILTQGAGEDEICPLN